ncbi:hypothetical protein ACFPOI_01955 [Nonomuraea angiospora]|uniref:Uncharacterized protein n=1 Tax=Nonomuraea angiospora TaxID=46172 RepID=A0ABR9M2Q0_9ACTN|nr:hypothetical protein [Nonomuraea angiospora]MBE1587169.1 hypothetical protein [Nonomuraea angiospora]
MRSTTAIEAPSLAMAVAMPRSLAALQQALLDLVLDKELGQITVADVTKRAGT